MLLTLREPQGGELAPQNGEVDCRMAQDAEFVLRYHVPLIRDMRSLMFNEGGSEIPPEHSTEATEQRN